MYGNSKNRQVIFPTSTERIERTEQQFKGNVYPLLKSRSVFSSGHSSKVVRTGKKNHTFFVLIDY